MPRQKILIIEDDEDINTIIFKHLSKRGYECTQAFSGSEGVAMLGCHRFDLIIMDLMLPGVQGEDVVKLIRDSNVQVPIIVVSARVSVSDKVTLLGMGVDDYLAKPFDLEELTARVEVQFRKAGMQSSGDIITYGEWVIDREAHTLVAKGEPVSLTRTEYAVVELLASHPNKVFTKHELYEMAWNEPYSVDDSTLNVHISNIRSKLKESGTDTYIQTVWGLGFKLAGDQVEGGVVAT